MYTTSVWVGLLSLRAHQSKPFCLYCIPGSQSMSPRPSPCSKPPLRRRRRRYPIQSPLTTASDLRRWRQPGTSGWQPIVPWLRYHCHRPSQLQWEPACPGVSGGGGEENEMVKAMRMKRKLTCGHKASAGILANSSTVSNLHQAGFQSLLLKSW